MYFIFQLKQFKKKLKEGFKYINFFLNKDISGYADLLLRITVMLKSILTQQYSANK